MNKKDPIKDVFEQLEGSFDVKETPAGHEHRFFEKLNAQAAPKKASKHVIWKVISVAAAVTLLLFLGGTVWPKETSKEAELASISPEMEETQSFFTTTINAEIQKLREIESPETKKVIEDALAEISVLETAYQQLKLDLVASGNNKRVINAMIVNFQNRILLLEQVSRTIEEIKLFNNTTDETLL